MPDRHLDRCDGWADNDVMVTSASSFSTLLYLCSFHSQSGIIIIIGVHSWMISQDKWLQMLGKKASNCCAELCASLLGMLPDPRGGWPSSA